MSELDKATIKPRASLSSDLLYESRAGSEYTIELSLADCENEYDKFNLYLKLDKSLEILKDETTGKYLIEKGEAIADADDFGYEIVTDEQSDYWTGIYVHYSGDKKKSHTGTAVTIKVRIPSYASYPDAFPLDIEYTPLCYFENDRPDTLASRMMQAYLFTKGIHNREYNNTFETEEFYGN